MFTTGRKIFYIPLKNLIIFLLKILMAFSSEVRNSRVTKLSHTSSY